MVTKWRNTDHSAFDKNDCTKWLQVPRPMQSLYKPTKINFQIRPWSTMSPPSHLGSHLGQSAQEWKASFVSLSLSVEQLPQHKDPCYPAKRLRIGKSTLSTTPRNFLKISQFYEGIRSFPIFAIRVSPLPNQINDRNY